MKITSFTSGDVDCTCYRLLQKEEQRLVEAILLAEPERLHWLRVDLRDVRKALKTVIDRNTKES